MVYKTRFGEIEIPESEIFIFEEGIPGFSHLRKFAIISFEKSEPVKWLVSLEDETVAFPIVNPWLIRADYSVEISQQDMTSLEVVSQEQVAVWAILSFPSGNVEEATVNLLAPIVLNLKNNKAKQIVQENHNYSVRHSLEGEINRSKRIMKKAQGGSE
ncbi:MAG: flagellar assembly protein FliW [Thermotogae bacterium]|nr:MAG: flagellar assembly protein FliW [Thermotogota bacterium]